MKIRGDIESVNLSTGEKFQRVVGDGESRLEKAPSAPTVAGDGPIDRTKQHYADEALEKVKAATLEQAIGIVEKAFENSWVVQDCIDAIRALAAASPAPVVGPAEEGPIGAIEVAWRIAHTYCGGSEAVAEDISGMILEAFPSHVPATGEYQPAAPQLSERREINFLEDVLSHLKGDCGMGMHEEIWAAKKLVEARLAALAATPQGSKP